MEQPEIRIITDGACRGNPGIGAWGAWLRAGTREKILWGFVPDTTNNRMELIAPLRALEALRRPSRVRVVSDSQYLVQGMTRWLAGWQKKNWRSAGGGSVKNRDLWEALSDASQGHALHWEWVRGHSGHPENEAVDGLINRVLDLYGQGGAAKEGEGWLT